MGSLRPLLASLFDSLPPPPVAEPDIKKYVERALEEAKKVKLPVDVKKSQWENLLRAEVFKLAKTEGEALKDEHTTYYDDLQTRLDVALEFTTLDACEQSFIFLLLQDLLDTQTIASCSHIFSWLELRAPRLTAGMVPQKGKALVLLRALNDLLRRLSKMGSNAMFCGRILTFLSGVFALGERSGVNLRGEYGPMWEGVQTAFIKKAEKVPEEDKTKDSETKQEDENKMDVDEKPPAQEKPEDDFYSVFWSLQLPFSRPPLFANSGTFSTFQEAVNRVLPVIKEHTTKERIMMGSRTGPNSLKRKREQSEGEEPIAVGEYFFAKFLTSPDLLDLELKDTHFRRQFLFQLVILLNHLLTFTKAAKDAWQSPKNRSLSMEFTLEPADAQWVQETISKAMDELKQTAPNGRVFAETVNVILEREKNWIKWKNDTCTPAFDKAPWSVEVDGKKVGLQEATQDLREKMREPLPPWKHAYGSADLTNVWEMGYRDLGDLESFSGPDDVKTYWKLIQRESAMIEARKKQLTRAAEQRAKALADKVAKEKAAKALAEKPATEKEEADKDKDKDKPADEDVKMAPPDAKPEVAADTPPAPLAPVISKVLFSTDAQIHRSEEAKQRFSWLALRAVRDQHLALFSKIGTGDVELLIKGIEAPQKESGSASPVVKMDGEVREKERESVQKVEEDSRMEV